MGTWVVTQVQNEACHVILLASAQQGRHLTRGAAGHVVHAHILCWALVGVQQYICL